jgi:hypothetical protein
MKFFRVSAVLFAFVAAFSATLALAQNPVNLDALKGLAPVTVLPNSPEGRAALAANYTVTGGIQNGAIRQQTLLPFAVQQQQALEDAFITGGNLTQLADGLGTTLGAAYVARAHYTDRENFTSISPRVAALIAYANSTSGEDSNAGKYFFANETTDGKTSVDEETKSILESTYGIPDVFGEAYHLTAGTVGANTFGDSRPFQTERNFVSYSGADYFNTPATNDVYNRGPLMDLTNSPSYPSGHTTYGYTGSMLLALLVPQRYTQMVARGAEYGNDRIVVGAHYAMDVLGGRTLALYDLAHLLANDPSYMGRAYGHAAPVRDFRAALLAARGDLTAALETACNNTIAVCSAEDHGRFSDTAADRAFYDSTQTYGLPVVYAGNAGKLEDIGKLAPEAGYLLTVVFPALTLEQADRILTETEGPGGGFLDNGSSFGVYSRLDMYAAAGRAAATISK